jgi:O-antigen ligase
MSVGSLLLLANAVIEWNWKEKWQYLKKNKLAFFLAAFFFVYLIGLINVEIWSKAIDAILMKVLLLGSPLVIASTPPLTKREINIVFHTFLISILFTTIYSFVYYCNRQIVNIREISRFISHIRFSLNITIAIVITLFYTFNIHPFISKIKLPYPILTCWLLFYMFISQTLTGIVIIVLLLLFTIAYLFIKYRKEIFFRWLIFVIILIVLAFFSYFTYITINYFQDKDAGIFLPAFTERGNPYSHDQNSIIENGHRIQLYICKQEMQEAWNQISDKNFEDVELTLIRYLNSKQLKKDYNGVALLSNQDIKNIELGIANVEYYNGFVLKRLFYPLFFTVSIYKKEGTIDQSSLFQRLELWNASWRIIKKNWLFGIGIGNHKAYLDKQLEEQQSTLMKKNMGCHNEFITLWCSAGIIVLFYFIFTLIAPFIFRRKLPLIYFYFFIIAVVSMFTEDTIDTHAGVTFFVFFNTLILFGVNEESMCI